MAEPSSSYDSTPPSGYVPGTSAPRNAAEFMAQGMMALVTSVFLTWEMLSVYVSPLIRKARQTAEKNTQTQIPAPADMVRFELREVYRDAEREQQLEPAPSDIFLEQMSFHGYSKWQAENYWAAHWTLPSANQGLEMFWRLRPGRVKRCAPFTRDDLKALLKRADYLPAYHEQLIETAYTPITRVDVRRLYRLGLIDADEVYNRFLDIGYSPDDAAMMKQYAESEVLPEESAVTLSEMKNAFMDGILSRDEFDAWLRKSGYSPESVIIMFRILESRMAETVSAETVRKLTKADIIAGFNEKQLSESEAVRMLVDYGYTATAAQYLIDVEKKQAAKKKVG